MNTAEELPPPPPGPAQDHHRGSKDKTWVTGSDPQTFRYSEAAITDAHTSATDKQLRATHRPHTEKGQVQGTLMWTSYCECTNHQPHPLVSL